MKEQERQNMEEQERHIANVYNASRDVYKAARDAYTVAGSAIRDAYARITRLEDQRRLDQDLIETISSRCVCGFDCLRDSTQEETTAAYAPGDAAAADAAAADAAAADAAAAKSADAAAAKSADAAAAKSAFTAAAEKANAALFAYAYSRHGSESAYMTAADEAVEAAARLAAANESKSAFAAAARDAYNAARSANIDLEALRANNKR
jgi:hypothetical protein